MTIRTNHYEVAFEAFLREEKIPYIAVDERRRALLGSGSLKNLDFIASPSGGDMSWLIDIKGRKFPSGRRNRYWKNWTTTDDLQSLSQWQRLLGPQFRGLLVFAYDVVGDMAPVPERLLFSHQDRLYAFIGVRLDLYLAWARKISPRWKTMAMPTKAFRQLAEPLQITLQTPIVSGGDFDRRRLSETMPAIA
ncbi:HYExAFE family protein [Blastopirellula marina]|uniref:Uncharacterized protein n=1 Tax=Blastopirellula marina TaxID=124 RepID=A0A2S8FWZ9_9BACT|nr:HYExAFE family protein [Blastopirellula marina]PQO36689.1 hypothetical protein C5Y98_11900 [Blastopirellula marina]PTL44519.1 hypothetical protein C5Y97_11910 [Blastopirellula marina]